MTLTINYNTGAENQTVEVNSIDEAMTTADNGASYTQCDITIEDENGDTVASRAWRDNFTSNYDEDGNPLAENPITIGNNGYYGDWIEA